MILIGRYLSPFVRRVAVSLQLAGLSYEHRALSTVDDLAEVKKLNPLGRVPALVLDDGEVLVDSNAILDHVDEMAGPSRALLPAAGKPRRQALQAVGLGLGVLEKGVAAVYERTKRPKELIHAPWRDQLDGQVKDGLAALERMLGDRTWFGGAKPNQADVTAVVGFDFLGRMLPGVVEKGAWPRLEALVRLADALPAFADTKPKA
ncbi:glutathione S-transferase family protein [Desertibaculum subflavum]|uniref:glutathione S-transferase family protein n=1 Tax=Desertibaculum subflavum TaxID=2268458 RepID=UPI000E67483F